MELSRNYLFAGLVLVAMFNGPHVLPLLAAESPLRNIRQLTYDGLRSGEGYFSPDGNRLIFQSERDPQNPFYQIFMLDFTTGDTHRVSPGLGKTTCAFFQPGSDRVLFASTHHDPEALAKQKEELEFRASGQSRRYSWDYDAAMDIFTASADGTDLRQLTHEVGYDAEGAFSPDGQWIVFTSLRHAYPLSDMSPEDQKRFELDPSYFGELYLMRSDGSEVRRLTHNPGYDGGPFFSPDGKRIVWRRFDEKGVIADIFTLELKSETIHRVTDFKSMSWAPYFHPSGDSIIFASNLFGFSNFELFMVDAEGLHEPVRMTEREGFDGLPVFSPDGKRLVWTSNATTQKKSQLFMANWNHTLAMEQIAASPLRKPSADAEPAWDDREITEGDLRQMVGTLASDEFEGRYSGSEGGKKAGEYLIQHLKRMGFETPGNLIEFEQPFTFTYGSEWVACENLFVETIQSQVGEPQTRPLVLAEDYQPLGFSANGEAEASVVLGGYGLAIPNSDGTMMDPFGGVEVKDKIVVLLRYVPEGVETTRRQELNRYAGLRYKALTARQRGAKAILVVTGPNSPGAGKLIPVEVDASQSGSGILAGSITDSVLNSWLEGTGKDLKTWQSGWDQENPHVESAIELPHVKLHLKFSLKRLEQQDRNIVAALPPKRPDAGYVLMGAHYDHLGYGDSGGSRQGKDEAGQIHNGADDNASGTSALLEIAAKLAKEHQAHPDRFEKGLMIAFWSGEELGLLGSNYFVEHPPVELGQIEAYLNFDMVGRLKENRLILQGVGSSTDWKKYVEKGNIVAGFDLVLQEDPYLPTDVTSFYPKKIPVLNFFTGSHDDYHRPSDDSDTLDYEGLLRIAQMGYRLGLDLISSPVRPAYTEVQRSQQAGSRDSLRAYLGTIPDYAQEVMGVKLSGVRKDGPADQGGLQAGDIIVGMAGQKITNIYDYTYALDAVKIGTPVEMVVRRGEMELKLSVTPIARP